MVNKSEEKFYTVSEFHNIVGNVISKATIYNGIKKGSIPVKYFGTKALIPAYWVDDFCRDYKCEVPIDG